MRRPVAEGKEASCHCNRESEPSEFLGRDGSRRRTWRRPLAPVAQARVKIPPAYMDRRFGMTRHVTGPLSGCPFLPEPRSTSGMCLQLHARGLKRMIAAQQSQSCLVPCSTTGFHLVPAGRSGCRQVGFMPGPRVIHPELAPPFAAGYKMYFSGGFLFRAVGSAGVQNGTFAGVFVPQVWNQHADKSASRNCRVGCRFRLYHGVSASYTTSHPTFEYMYTSVTSPKTPPILEP